MKDYYTVKEFSKQLDVSCNTIRKYIKIGYINAYKIGPTKKSHFRINKEELTNMFDKIQTF